MTTNEIRRRETAALAAIQDSFGTPAAAFGANLFVSHHVQELDADYWLRHAGSAQPAPAQVLALLALRKHWSPGDDAGMAIFDFTLPGDVTDYVLSVLFDGSGRVEDISMES